MNLRRLAIFRAVVRHGGFIGAAEQLHMAQPAVSIAIKKLEQELEVLLFNRSGRKAVLTSQGKEVLSRAERILDEVESLKQDVSQGNQLLKGELSLSCPSMLATYYLPELLSGFLGAYPGLSANIAQVGTQQSREQLLNREVELAIITLEDGQSNAPFDLVPLVQEELVVCTPRHHPWAEKQQLHITELDQQPMAFYESGYFVRRSLDLLCQEFDVHPDIRVQTNFLPLLIRSVKQGLGCTVGLTRMAEQEGELAAVPLRPRVELNLALAKLQHNPIDRANLAFFDWVAANT